MTKTNIYRLKGGSGATTIACAMALTSPRPVVLGAATLNEYEDLAACLGLPNGDGDDAYVNDKVTMRLIADADAFDDSNIDLIMSTDAAIAGWDNILVTRLCYLALRKAVAATAVLPTSIIVIKEPMRALDVKDAERCVSRPAIAIVNLDPAVARSIDAGLLSARMPSSLRGPIERLHIKETV